MKPKPLVGLNHFTVPVATFVSPRKSPQVFPPTVYPSEQILRAKDTNRDQRRPSGPDGPCWRQHWRSGEAATDQVFPPLKISPERTGTMAIGCRSGFWANAKGHPMRHIAAIAFV